MCVCACARMCMLLIVRDGGFLRACYNLLFSYSSLGSHIHHRDVTLLESKELGNSNTQLLKGKSPGHSESVTFTAPEQRGKVVLESIHCLWEEYSTLILNFLLCCVHPVYNPAPIRALICILNVCSQQSKAQGFCVFSFMNMTDNTIKENYKEDWKTL